MTSLQVLVFCFPGSSFAIVPNGFPVYVLVVFYVWISLSVSAPFVVLVIVVVVLPIGGVLSPTVWGLVWVLDFVFVVVFCIFSFVVVRVVGVPVSVPVPCDLWPRPCFGWRSGSYSYVSVLLSLFGGVRVWGVPVPLVSLFFSVGVGCCSLYWSCLNVFVLFQGWIGTIAFGLALCV